jgi:pantoate kinase
MSDSSDAIYCRTIPELKALIAHTTKFAEELGIVDESGECTLEKIEEVKQKWLDKT